jgi:hypothetical protein
VCLNTEIAHVRIEIEEEETCMEKDERNSEQDPAQATAHIAGAHQILRTLQEKMGQHPELATAITKLEMALSILAVKTGGQW